MPAALPIDWTEIRRACEAGMGLSEAAKKWGVESAAVRQRSKRENWIHPVKVARLAEQYRQQKRDLSPTVTNSPQASQPTAEEAVTESLVTMGESLRHTVLSKTLAALKRADLASLPIDSWSDAKTAVEVGLKASGLEAASGQGPSVNVLFSSPAPPVIEIDGHKSGPAQAPAIEDLL